MLSRCYTGGKERAPEGGCTAAAPCYALAASSPALTGFTHLTSFARAKRSKSHAAATPFACATWVPVSPRGALPRGALVAGSGGRGAGGCPPRPALGGASGARRPRGGARRGGPPPPPRGGGARGRRPRALPGRGPPRASP